MSTNLHTLSPNLISTYINTKMCVCLWFRVFLGHLESYWDTLWHKCALWPRKCSKTILFKIYIFFAELLPFFYIISKPLYVRIYNCGFRFVVVMCKLCNFLKFLSFKITELLPFLWYLIPILPHNLIIWHTNMTIWHACRPVTARLFARYCTGSPHQRPGGLTDARWGLQRGQATTAEIAYVTDWMT